MSDYSKKLHDLRHNLHKDIVQTSSLIDVFFNGDYIFEEPVKTVIGNVQSPPKLVSIKGIDNMCDIIAEDGCGKGIYLRYIDVPLETLNEVLLKLRGKKFLKTVELI